MMVRINESRLKASIILLLAIAIHPGLPSANAQCSPQQLAKVLAGDAQQFEDFAVSVSINSDTAIVGAPYHTTTITSDGAAYIFVRNGNTWTQQAKLVANDPGNDNE